MKFYKNVAGVDLKADFFGFGVVEVQKDAEVQLHPSVAEAFNRRAERVVLQEVDPSTKEDASKPTSKKK